MARRTAMNKEPGKVSIAVPDYEKRRLGTQESYLPGGLQNMPEPMPKEQLKRVSPGVYRNSLGELVGSRGQQLPGMRRRTNAALEGARRGADMAAGRGSAISSALQGARQGLQGAPNQGPIGQWNPAQSPSMGDMAQQLGNEMTQDIRDGRGQGMGQRLGQGIMENYLPGRQNGPGSPFDVNPYFDPRQDPRGTAEMEAQMRQLWQQMQQNPGSFPQQKPAPLTPEMNDQLQGVMRDMRNQRQPNTQFDPRMMQPYLPFQPNQQPPMNWGNMRYDFPQGQAPTPEQMKAALQPFQPQGQQQPNSVSGMLKRYS